MTTLKYSRQRESIKNYLVSTHEHPTADDVYTHVKKEFPNVSLSTIYRNLNLLADIGEVIKITAPDGRDRFDVNLHPHHHFFCTCCERILDLDIDLNSVSTLQDIASKNFDGMIESSSVTFYGKCKNCIEKS